MKKLLKWTVLSFLMFCTISATLNSIAPVTTGLVFLVMWGVGYWIAVNWRSVYTKFFGEGEVTLKTIYEERSSYIEGPVHQESVNGSTSTKQLTLEEESYLNYLTTELHDKYFDPPIALKSPATHFKEWKLKRIQKRSKPEPEKTL